MPLIDSSAWIEYLNRSDKTVSRQVAEAIREGTAATTDVVMLEVLSGTTDEDRLSRWTRLLARCEYLEQVPRADVDSAAALYRSCRRRGETPRAPNDCLVAAVAIRHNVEVVHSDRDFEVLARHTPLRLART
jgi:predicted nucleic acid-binding protein